MSLQGQTALVTGGSRGIGRAICIRLAQEGADLVINCAGNISGAEETAKLCEAYGVRTLCIQADISDAQACGEMFAKAKEFGGKIDILVNNAGITRDQLLLRMKEEDYQRVIDVNLTGTFHCMKEASRMMLRQRYGRIISISSVVGVRGNAGQINYAAAKAGIIGMTKSLAKELAAKQITVNAVAPGWIETEMSEAVSDEAKAAFLAQIPAGRPGKPEDIANAVCFLAQPESAYITGQVLCVDGGMAM
ncbi:MAG: 3-oxoacyl-[Eubacterium sp.]|nr:3-oxoacyl-[acyl-carrier-protein] reductase [Eubacterium sp.]